MKRQNTGTGTVKLLEGLGVGYKEARQYEDNNYFYTISHILIPCYRWVDILMLTLLIDHGAYVLVEDFAQSSYAPWARFAKKVLEEETGHMDFGNDFIRRQVNKIGKAQVQRAQPMVASRIEHVRSSGHREYEPLHSSRTQIPD